MNKMGLVFEGFLWNSRFVVLSAVLASLAAAFAMFFMATVDAFYMISHLIGYASPSLSPELRADLRGETVTHVVEIVDGYLLATVLLIFALGLYELFISAIDPAKGKKISSSVLMITSLDDLKSRLAKVILMILIVKFFEYAVDIKYETPLDLLYLAGGIALIGVAIYLSHAEGKESSEKH